MEKKKLNGVEFSVKAKTLETKIPASSTIMVKFMKVQGLSDFHPPLELQSMSVLVRESLIRSKLFT